MQLWEIIQSDPVYLYPISPSGVILQNNNMCHKQDIDGVTLHQRYSDFPGFTCIVWILLARWLLWKDILKHLNASLGDR